MDNLAESKQWYVVTAKPHTEKAVGRRLTQCGVEHLLPLQRQLRQWHDRKKWVETPLFFSYIFVNVASNERNSVFKADTHLKYLFVNGRIAVLREAEIERIQRLCSYPGEVFIEQAESFAAGDEVEITEGHFAGLRGQIVQTGGKRKLKIAIAGLHCVAMVEINEQNVRKAL